MNPERAQMCVRLANLRQKEKRLTSRVDELCTVIRANLNTCLAAVKDLNVPEAAGQMDELVMTFAELHGALGEIARLEKELE